MPPPLFVRHSRCGNCSPAEALVWDHHLLRSKHGGFSVCFTFAPTPVTSRKVQRGLGTRSRATARIRRDALLFWLAGRGVLIGLKVSRSRALRLEAEDRRWLEDASRRLLAGAPDPFPDIRTSLPVSSVRLRTDPRSQFPGTIHHDAAMDQETAELAAT